MNVPIYAVKNERFEVKLPRAENEMQNENYKLRENNEELKLKLDELENRMRGGSFEGYPNEIRGESNSSKSLYRSQSPVPTFPKEYDNLMTRQYSKEEKRDRDRMQMTNNGSGNISATNYYQGGYASPATKSAVSDRSWIDNEKVNQQSSLDSANVIIDKLTKVISHLQNELSKNLITISQLAEENRQLQVKSDVSYNKDSS